MAAFKTGLTETGFVEGQQLSIAYRWAEGRYEKLPALAAELVGLRVVAILAAGGAPSALAAKAATSEIPIVFSALTDAVRYGLVASLSRPGGNVTGMSVFNNSLAPKRLELLRELVPNNTVVALLANPNNPISENDMKEAVAAARSLGLQLHVLHAQNDSELETAIPKAVTLAAGALVVTGDPFFDSQREKLVGLAAQSGVPAIYAWREYVDVGGLISYGTSIADAYRHAGVYVGRILKGEKAANLPVLQPTKFELVISLTTSKKLGLTIPPSILARADEVIE
ncbi:MAG: ABC transporter substrate-binding protein [Reyranella sp.]|nr:ABC transporter substrate-binding protein [Reyranella sp.]